MLGGGHMRPLTSARILFAIMATWVALSGWGSNQPLEAQSAVTLTVSGSQRFQRMDGFGVNANVNSWNGGELRPALDTLVDTLGAGLFRVYIDNADWEASNDDGDPFSFNWSYYNGVYASPRLEELWGTMAVPQPEGDHVRPGPELHGTGARLDGRRPREPCDGRRMGGNGRLARVLRARRPRPVVHQTRSFNEPDWNCLEGACVDAAQAVRLLKKLGARLDALGLADIRLVAPETASPSNATGVYMPAMLADPALMTRVDDFAFHSYSGDSAGANGLLSGSAFPDWQFWISEQSFGTEWFTSITNLLGHLRDGASATLVFKAYDGQDNHHPPGEDFGLGLLAYNTSTRTYSPRKAVWSNAQIFRFVRTGAWRIQASSSSSTLATVAFFDETSGRLTIVGQNTSTSSRTLSGSLTGLPAATRLEFYQTTNSVDLQRGADVTVSNGTFSAPISATSVFTLTAVLAPDAEPPTAAMTAPLDGATVSGLVSVAASATDNAGVDGVQFFLDGAALGAEDTSTPFGLTWDSRTAAGGLHELTARARDGAGNVATAAPVWVTVDNSDTQPPTVAITSPAGGVSVSGQVAVTASASDNIGVGAVQFLLDGVALGAEDPSAPYR